MSKVTNLNPQVIELLKPIINNTTKLYYRKKYQQSQPAFSQIRLSESEAEKAAKRECIHMIFKADGSIDYIPEPCDQEGYKICPVCGRLIPLKFESKNEDTLMSAIEVVNQMVFFGTILGLRADAIKTLIGIKAVLPDVAQLVREINEYVKLDDSNRETMDTLGKEYGGHNSLSSWY